jgi:heme/copper-type cytochrome/quinol oxidase subunit 4
VAAGRSATSFPPSHVRGDPMPYVIMFTMMIFLTLLASCVLV